MSNCCGNQSIENNKPLFIVMEGIDGCGKSTQCKLLKEYFNSINFEVVLTREPGGTMLAEKLREIILNPDISLNDHSELLLFMASRAAHVNEIIKPALKSGKNVICDRFYLSTFAYQGYGRGLNLNDIELVNSFASYNLKPDVTIIFDIDVNASLARTGKDADRFEDAGSSFMEKVALGYREISKKEQNCYLIDANKSIDDIFLNVKDILNKYIKGAKY